MHSSSYSPPQATREADSGNPSPVPARLLYNVVQQGEERTNTKSTEEEVLHRGGFATSICDLFQDPHDRTSCCALTCCGTFLQDRNQYLLTDEMPPPWWTRILFYLGGFMIAVILGVLLQIPFLWLFYVIFMMLRASTLRQNLRFKLKQRMQQTEPANDIPSDSPSAHSCMACINNDKIYRPGYNNSVTPGETDFCGSLWNMLAAWFGKACCNCWCNCCGTCATAQEHRELRRILPKEKFLMDYVTMEPFGEYYPKIEQLRRDHNDRLWDHLGAVSLLSKKLMNILLGFIATGTLLAFLVVSKKFTERLLILVATLANAFLILYFVHWRNHKFDISVDAVIKLFAAGFILSNLTAMGIEMILEVFSGLVLAIFLGVELGVDAENSGRPLPEGDALTSYAFEHHIATFLVYLFFKSFVEAALVEELVKYFSYFMVEHGDFIFRYEEDPEAGGDDDSVGTTETLSLTPPGSPNVTSPTKEDSNRRFQPRKALSPSLTASIVTVAMVATATGFACSENLGYVFGQKSIKTELLVLVMRALLPIHSLCAAIQSIGIVRRDVEKDPAYGVGWAVFPAVMLHGTFDFALMVIAFFQLLHADSTSSPSGVSSYVPPETPEESDPSITKDDILAALIPGIIISGLGLLYYFHHSSAQRARLAMLDQNQPEIVVSSPFI